MKKLFISLIIIINLLVLSCCNKDDFNLQEDIKNIYHFNRDDGFIVDPAPSYSLAMQIDNLKLYSYYLAETNFDKTYILCGYVEKDKIILHGRTLEYYENLTWIKYENINDIVESYNGKIIFDLFVVYDITIKKNIINNVNYLNSNKFSFKYYYDIEDTYKNNSEVKKPYDEFIIWFRNDLRKTRKEYIKDYGLENLYISEYYMQHTFEVSKTNKDYYIIMDDKKVYEESNNIKYLLKGESGVYYESIEQVAVNDDELTQYIEVNNGENYYLHKVKIKVKDLVEICKEAKK